MHKSSKKLIKAAHGFTVNRFVYNSKVDTNLKSLCRQMDRVRSNSVGKLEPRSSQRSGFVKTRMFHNSNVYTTIGRQQGHSQSSVCLGRQIDAHLNPSVDTNRYAILGDLDENEIQQLLWQGSSRGGKLNHSGVNTSNDRKRGHMLKNDDIKVQKKNGCDQARCLEPRITQNQCNKVHDLVQNCDSTEVSPSRDLITCVQSIGCLEYCNSMGDAIHKNNQALGDNNSPSVDALALACEGSCEACVSHGEKCESIVCNSNGQAEISHTGGEAGSTNPDGFHILNSHSEPDLTKSQHIIELTKMGKNTIKKINVQSIRDKRTDLRLCLEQQKNALGFLPINDLAHRQTGLSLKPKVILSDNYDPVAVHHMVRNTGKYNFQDARILLPSKINFELFEELAQGYWDWQLPHFIKYGFPLDFPYSKENCLKSGRDNHASATKFPTHVDKYLETELAHGAIIGPFSEPPYGSATHVSPFMSRDKADSDTRRIIIDLSWPLESSINYFTPANIYMDTIYKLQYPTVDNITEKLKQIGTHAVLYKIDLSRAFRQLRIDPSDFNLLCLWWKGSYYSDQYCPFGHRSGSMGMTRLTDFFRFLMTQKGYHIYSYVDDMIGCAEESNADSQCDFLLSLLERLGFPISPKKLVRPTKVCNCLGIVIDTTNRTLSVSEEKQQEIIKKCNDLQNQSFITKRQLQSILGSIMFVHKCVRSCRYFTNRLLQALREADSNIITVTKDMKRDIAWFQAFMPTYNGLTTYDHRNPPAYETIEIDACLEGIGGVWGNRVYASSIPDILRSHPEMSITQYEMLNILVALRVWGHMWRHQHVVFNVDNAAVVTICNKGYTKCNHLGAMIRNIWLVTAIWDIELVVIHIPGKQNCVADTLSRLCKDASKEIALSALIQDPIWYHIDQNYFDINYNI